jgi:predicted site-specific integrase-resolvase
MRVVHAVLSWLLPSIVRRRPDATDRLQMVSEDIAEASEIASVTAEAVVESAKADQAVVEDIVSGLQQRLARLNQRRTARIHDPRLTVIVETIRILEGRP